jgi:hypothetical protein
MPTVVVPQLDLRTTTDVNTRLSLLSSKVSSAMLGTALATAAAGHAFGNQPQSDGLHVVSDTTGDTRQVTIYGTTTGTNMLSVETVTLPGTATPNNIANTTKVNWGYILGVTVSEAHATAAITIQEASADQTVTTIAATTTQHGVASIAAESQNAYDMPVSVVASDTSVKTVGLIGLDCLNNTIYSAITLTNTTAVLGLQGFRKVTHVLVGDLESTRSATFSIGGLTYGAGGVTLTDLGGGPQTADTRIMLPFRYLHWCLYTTITAATAGVDDRLLLTLYG